jgi:hypothetical protein
MGCGTLAGSELVCSRWLGHVLNAIEHALIVLHTVAHTLKAYLRVSMQPAKDTFMPQSPNALTDARLASCLSPYRKLLRLAAVLCTAGFMAHAQAMPFLDASDDFLSSYTGAKDADLDVVQADVVIDPEARTITFSGAMRGNIDTRSNKLYVFGVDRGAGAAGGDLIFHGPLGGQPRIGEGVRWDAAVALTASGQALFFDVLAANPGLVPLPGVPVSISGHQITATVPLALFASQGFKLREYTFNLWPRSEGSLANTVVPDFAPDQGNARVTIAGKRTRFELVRSARAAAAGCLAYASAEVHIRAEDSVEVMEVSVQGLPPKTEFDVFITQVPNAPFGMAWYQGDIETNHHGRARQTFVGRFSNETFVVAPGSAPAPQVHHNAFPDAQLNPPTAPVHTFHVGIWFNSPADAVKAGCPGDVTPFNGQHNAGIQALSSRNFLDAQGPLLNVKP